MDELKNFKNELEVKLLKVEVKFSKTIEKQNLELLRISIFCKKLSDEMIKRQTETIELYKEVIALKKEFYGIDDKELEKTEKTIH